MVYVCGWFFLHNQNKCVLIKVSLCMYKQLQSEIFYPVKGFWGRGCKTDRKYCWARRGFYWGSAHTPSHTASCLEAFVTCCTTTHSAISLSVSHFKRNLHWITRLLRSHGLHHQPLRQRTGEKRQVRPPHIQFYHNSSPHSRWKNVCLVAFFLLHICVNSIPQTALSHTVEQNHHQEITS